MQSAEVLVGLGRTPYAGLGGATETDRIAIAQRRRADMASLGPIEQRYGVPRDILLAVWAMESGFECTTLRIISVGLCPPPRTRNVNTRHEHGT